MDYAALIPQTEDQLKALEARQPIACFRDRLRFIRLLKTQHAKTQQQAGQAVGLGIRQSQRPYLVP